MISINKFLSELNNLNIKLWVEDEQLRYKAPKGTLTPSLRTELVERKAEIITFLSDAQLDDSEAKLPVPLSRDDNNNLPLSFAQQRLWFLEQLEDSGSATYNMASALRLLGSLHFTALEQSLLEIVQRHEILRTTFQMLNGTPMQMIHPFSAESLRLSVVDLQLMSSEKQTIEVQRLASEDAQRPFDLAKGPLLRTTLWQLGPQEHVIGVTMHHIISDGWSLGLFIREFTTLYEAFSKGQPSPLTPLPIQYADFAYWQRQWLSGKALQKQLNYWQQQLADVPALLELPTDHSRPPIQRFQGSIQPFEINEELSNKLNKLSQQADATLFMTLLAVFVTLLRRYSGVDDLVVGSPIAGRNNRKTESLIGFFVNTLVLRFNCSENPSFLDLLAHVRQVCLDAYAHQDVPFEQLVEVLQPERNLSHTPLFQVMFVLQNTPTENLALANLSISPFARRHATAKFDLTLAMTETAQGFSCTFEYNTDLFNANTIIRMVEHFKTLLAGIVTNPAQSIAELPLLTEKEKHQLLVEWNNTAAAYPQDQCIHQLFEAQVERTPEAIAVVFEDQQLTYQELNIKANQIAHYLQSVGVKPEVVVGICVERSLEMIIGLLAILKAGGAYVPFDPNYPLARLAFMLEDSQVLVLLTHSNLIEKLPEHEEQVVCLDTFSKTFSRQSEHNPDSDIAPSNLAYVIYTSGSTGKPKGAMNTHFGICNRLLWMQDAYQLTVADSVLQKTPFSFDVSVWEFFWPLLVGARLVVAKPWGHQDSAYLVKLIVEQNITTLHFVPSMLQVFVGEVGLENCTSLKRVICSGEALPFDIQERFFARSSAQLHNLYGPTEAAIDVTYWQCQRESYFNLVPIGRPIANLQIYILDQYFKFTPIGIPGELHIGGIGLARGYIDRPELTAEKFIPNPFSNEPGSRLYKTGDLVRYLPDGNIEYLNRLDNQVKIRGFRIELGEIETFLTQHPTVRESVVLAHEEETENKRLIAYLVPEPAHTFPILQRIKMERQGLFNDKLLYELPNGMTITHLNPNESQFIYQEIFEERNYLKHGITINEGDCVFDVGAHIGLFTLFAAQECHDVTVYAFEPIPPLFELLQINAEIHGFKVKLFNCALSSETTSDTFTYYPHVSLISGRFADSVEEREVVKSFLLKQQESDANTSSLSNEMINELLAERLKSTHFTCQLRTLSEVMAENGVQRIDLLKIDVEKSELDVLCGINDSDWPKIRQIIVEVHNLNGRLKTVSKLLKDKGYKLTIEQEALLEKAELYNIYGIRPNVLQPPTSESQDISEISVKTWHSLNQLIKNLRGFLKDKLPDYMVPSTFVVLETWPLTPNGKLDRHALLQFSVPRYSSKETFVAPRTHEEELLAGIWAEVLGLEQVGIHDNFFELGGHSLLATQVISRIRDTFSIELPLRYLFESPNITELSEQIQKARDQHLLAPPIKPIDRQGDLPLSFAQERLWFLEQLTPDNPFYNTPAAVRLTGLLNIAALKQSLFKIVQRHEVLRITFSIVNGIPIQVIHPLSAKSFRFSRVNLQGLPPEKQLFEVQRFVTLEAQRTFDLKRGPLFRATLLQLHTDEYVLLVTIHHIVIDGWSMGILIRELSTLYEAFSTSQPFILPELPIQYADFAYWQRQWLSGIVFETQLRYWQQRLANAPRVLELPSDHPRPPVHTFRGHTEYFKITTDLTKQLKSLSQQAGATLFMTTLAAFAILLERYSGQQDIVIGSPIANRTRKEIEPLIGFFVNTLVLRIDLSGNPTFFELLEQVRQVTLEAYAHQDLPFEQLVESLQLERDMTRNPLTQVVLAFQNAPMSSLKLSNLILSPIAFEAETVRFDLEFHVWEAEETLVGNLHYYKELFDATTIVRLLGHFQTLLLSIAANPKQAISEYYLLSEAERHQLLVKWNPSETEYSQTLCVHQWFETQVDRTPQSIAVVFENQQLTYRELNAKANQLAYHLQTLGVKPEIIVGICVERSMEMVIGLLGILKAGGAYLSLEPSYPQERLGFILEDAGVSVLLSQEKLINKLPKSIPNDIVCLDTDWSVISTASSENPVSGVMPSNVAYVIYTSGSTGKPKGVLVLHSNVTRLFTATQSWFHFNEQDIWTLFHSYAFDFSVWELWGALLYGGCVVVVPYWISRSPDAFYELLCTQRITVLNQTPSAFRQLIQAEERLGKNEDLNLRFVIFGGEALEFQTLKSWFEQHGDQFPQLVNMYGITETTVHVTYRPLTRSALFCNGSVIGVPIPDLQAYILDHYLQPTPIGVPGELHIGGAGVARGYLNRPELTAERFIGNPFSDKSEARLYKTGDLARYLPDGDIEYLGRIDHQVKIRGFRIELGEIESVLVKHPAVRETVVIMQEDQLNDQRLVAYFVPDLDYQTQTFDEWCQEGNTEIVSQWEHVFDENYSQSGPNQELTFNITGWNSSYTGLPIQAEEMREWVDSTVDAILSLQPHSVLEIGCGTGLLLSRIAPHCTQYWGTDFSPVVLQQVEQLKRSVNHLDHVVLFNRKADDFSDIEQESFDTIILNSVIQYFPSVDYLLEVLNKAIKVVKPGGYIFVGDVRSLLLLKAYHASVQFYQAPDSLTHLELQQRVQQHIDQEEELVIDPTFFMALTHHHARMIHLKIQPKRGHYHNELTRFRYDVIFQIGNEKVDVVEMPQIDWIDWQTQKLTVSALRQQLIETKPKFLGLRGVPNARIENETKMLDGLPNAVPTATVSQLRNALSKHQPVSIDPEELWQLSDELPYNVEISWANASADGSYDVLFKSRTGLDKRQIPIFNYQLPTPNLTFSKAWHHYANNPRQSKLSRQLVPQLRQFLQEQLPIYMVPFAFVMLDSLPLTPNGKVDRRTLSKLSVKSLKLSNDTFVAPRRKEEELLAGIWSDVLGIERVGIHDNFFELGGHSLLATQLMSRMGDTFSVELPLRHLFESPTIAGIAQIIDMNRQAKVLDTKTVIDLNAEAVLEPTIQPPNVLVEPLLKPNFIFLTGATGFLGTYLLYELLVQTKADIYCLVRSSNAEEGKKRLESTLKSYSLLNEDFGSRIIPIIGDLSEPLLGIAESQFRHLAHQIDIIYHNGAWVNHIYPYSVLKAANVIGTQEVLRLASQIKPKPVHFISTSGVLFSAADAKVKIARESDFLDGSQVIDYGYTQSKWVAEKLVRQAAERGLPVCIYRPTRIGGDSQRGISSTHDFLNLALKGYIQLGKVPILDDREENIIPVDYISRAIVHLSRQTDLLGKTFHFANPRSILLSDLLYFVRSLGYLLEETSYVQWRTELSHHKENALYPFLSLFPKEAFSNERLSRTGVIPQFDCQNTLEGLIGTDIVCPPVDTELFSLYFSYFWRSGFLAPPPRRGKK